MYKDCVDTYRNAVVPAFESYLEASILNKADFDLIGPARSAVDHVHHFRQELEPLYGQGEMAAKVVGQHIRDYDILNRVANLFKHKSSAKSGALIKDRSQIQQLMVVNGFDSANGPYMYFQMRVMVHLDTGEYRDLLDVVTNVMNGWGQFLVNNNLIEPSKAKFYNYTGNNYFTKAQADNFPDPRKVAIPGEEFNLTILGRSYNYNTKSFDIVPFK